MKLQRIRSLHVLGHMRDHWARQNTHYHDQGMNDVKLGQVYNMMFYPVHFGGIYSVILDSSHALHQRIEQMP